MKNYKYKACRPLTAEYKQTRNEIILRMRKDGYSLQKISDRFDVSREYIRQILKKEFDITGYVSFDPREEIKSDEYSVFDLVKLTGYEMQYIGVLLRKELLPKPSRKLEKNVISGIDNCFWKKTDIDRWISLKIKYLKIALEGFINERLKYPYKFTYYKIQKRYKFLLSLDSGGWKGKLSYNSRRNQEVMKEYNNLITPVKYVPTDYSKYLNMRSKEHFAEKGLHNGTETTAMIDVSGNVLCRYRRSGILKEGIHYFTGDHYFQRYMYHPEKTKKAILDAGFNLVISRGQKERWAKRGNK